MDQRRTPHVEQQKEDGEGAEEDVGWSHHFGKNKCLAVFYKYRTMPAPVPVRASVSLSLSLFHSTDRFLSRSYIYSFSHAAGYPKKCTQTQKNKQKQEIERADECGRRWWSFPALSTMMMIGFLWVICLRYRFAWLRIGNVIDFNWGPGRIGRIGRTSWCLHRRWWDSRALQTFRCSVG